MRTINYRMFLATTILFAVGLLVWMIQSIDYDSKNNNQEIAIDAELAKGNEKGVTSDREAIYSIPRTLRYRFLAINRTGDTLENVKLTTFSPLGITATQKTIKLEANESFNLLEDAIGNQAMEFVIDKVPPYSTKVFNIEAQLLMAYKPQPTPQGSDSIYLQNEALLDLENEEIQRVASTLQLENDGDSARAIYDWVKNNLTYSGYISSDLGASYAIRTKQGDCTEYAYLLAALARINNIPARIMAGYAYSNNAILRPYDYHNWVELYINNRWNIVDPLNDVFFDDKASYIALRVLGENGQLNNLGSQKGIKSDPRLEIKMQ